MNDQNILYLLAFIGWLVLVSGKFFDRPDGAWEWIKEYAGFLVVSLLTTAGTVLVGFGDDVDPGSNAARTLAFTLAATVGEGIWRTFTLRKAAQQRKAYRASKGLK